MTKISSLTGFFISGAVLILAAHIDLDWLGLLAYLGAAFFCARACKLWGRDKAEHDGAQDQSGGGCFAFLGLWIMLWAVALVFDGMDGLCALIMIACGYIWFSGR